MMTDETTAGVAMTAALVCVLVGATLTTIRTYRRSVRANALTVGYRPTTTDGDTVLPPSQ